MDLSVSWPRESNIIPNTSRS